MITKQKFTDAEIKHRTNLLEFYRTEEGTMELARRLKDFKFFEPISENDIALRNYGVLMLDELGIFDQDKIVEVVRLLLSMPAFLNEEKKRCEDITSKFLRGK